MSAPASDSIRSLVLSLSEIGAIKFGSFTLKSGIQSPFYVDLRLTVSHPPILRRVAAALAAAASDAPHSVLCGVPYTALPFATVMSIESGVPMVMRRKEAKGYGTKRIVEGVWKDGDACLVVEDLVTSGLSVMETVAPLVEAGMTVTDVVVLLDREQGARANLERSNVQLHAVLTITSMVDILLADGRIDDAVASSVRQFVAENQVVTAAGAASVRPGANVVSAPAVVTPVVTSVTYEERAERAGNRLLKRLFTLMAEKKTNLAVAADVTTKAELLGLADAVGPEICVLKTHADVIRDWDEGTGAALRAAADKHNFLIFEDRKFADIGNTVHHQCSGGVHRISEWADIINAHPVPGPGIVSGLQKACKESGRDLGLLLLAQMSSEGNLASGLDGYTGKTIGMADGAKDFVCGFISMGKIAGDEFVYMTPGVQLQKGGDGLGQQYNTPASVVGERGSDVIIVGRGVYKAADAGKVARTYREEGWKAYVERCGAMPR
jgi:uridine monophosphate synthetase